MFPELNSDRYILKQIIPLDQQFIYEGLSDPTVIQFYGVSFDSFESTTQQMQFYNSLIEEKTGTWWKIVDKKAGERVGAIGFNNYQKQHKKAEIGYWLLPAYWGKGIIREILPIVLHHLQQEVGLHRIEAVIEDGNERSRKTLEQAGFVHEGMHRDCEVKNGRFISLHMYAYIAVGY